MTPSSLEVILYIKAMLVAGEAIHHRHPVYGLYVVGEHWYFMVFHAATYCISSSFAADGEAIFEIFKMPQALKAILIDIAKQDA